MSFVRGIVAVVLNVYSSYVLLMVECVF